MTWAILLAFLVVVGVMSLAGRRQVPWSGKLRRVNAGVARQAEWTAPDVILDTVREDYLGAMRWLPESLLQDWSEQWANAPYYLSGLQLKRHQEILKRYRMGKAPRYTGIMSCQHHVEVRHFSDDGERCLVIDRQTERLMTTYDYWTHEIRHAQHLDDGAVVYEMVYDKQARRWKLDNYIQELPTGWGAKGKRSGRVKLLSALPPTIGRDS